MSDSFSQLQDLLEHRRFAILTGAGISTDSGIPDYRGPETRRRARNPIQYRAFMRDPRVRDRYWARAMLGWPRVRDAAPNDAHRAVTELLRRGHATGLITQNVDGLHAAAGAGDAVELHGALREVVCIECHALYDREAVQRELEIAHPHQVGRRAAAAPDGDADTERVEGVETPHCACGGPLKPNVVFFGENVPKTRVDRAFDIVDAADALLVVGSSLAVFSGYRFVLRAAKRGQPVAIVNLGETRGDGHADVKLDAGAAPTLDALIRGFAPAVPPPNALPSR